MPGNVRLHPLQEAILAKRGARRPFLVSQQQHAALVAEQLPHAVGGKLAAFQVVGGHEADDLIGGQIRVHDHRRDPGALRFFHRAHQRALVERREHDAVHALAEEALDHLHLLLAVVLAQRALPGDVHLDPAAIQLARRLDRPAWMLFQNSCVVPLGTTPMA